MTTLHHVLTFTALTCMAALPVLGQERPPAATPTMAALQTAASGGRVFDSAADLRGALNLGFESARQADDAWRATPTGMIRVPAAGEPRREAKTKTGAFNGTYRLQTQLSGSCYERIRVVPEAFLNSYNKDDIGFYGLPEGQGLVIEQVLDVNNGLRLDENTNPMALRPWQSGLIGYRPRMAQFDGTTLSYVTGHLSKTEPNLERGFFFQASLSEGLLRIRQGSFERDSSTTRNDCLYVRTD